MVSVDVKPKVSIPSGSEVEGRLVKDLRSYKASAVHRLTNLEAVASLAVRVTDVLRMNELYFTRVMD